MREHFAEPDRIPLDLHAFVPLPDERHLRRRSTSRLRALRAASGDGTLRQRIERDGLKSSRHPRVFPEIDATLGTFTRLPHRLPAGIRSRHDLLEVLRHLLRI